MRNLLSIALFTTLASASWAKAGPDRPDTFSKNGQPCFAEICLGDRLEDLADLRWESAPIPGRPNNNSDARSRANYPDAHRAAYGWWDDDLMRTVYQGRFDNRFIPMAPKYALGCPDDTRRANHYRLGNVRRLTGTYTTASGLATEVDVVLAPDTSDPERKTVYTVAAIRRTVPSTDAGEAHRISETAKARYQGIRGVLVIPSPNRVAITFSTSPSAGGTQAQKQAWQDLAQAPRCTSATTRSID